ncbi:NitT/TauT family transport system substrate-binding protein [Aneurinibacillus soli]|uniref:NMT1/THI5 like protein n=2 Tax=Aneurinibacillus soli TaxID=1500254 RepID=A0A0U5B6G7_9BACL|nr:MqnA/MqnD/SBP family protein [Aneurinibacillus soli]PYE62934.1 NitT/TauT family transport system substrate-binding protein [Aneurinibacillus soli]BAU29007.1 NMT1/THI5 like protein [Aneurinibacillus soli]
MMIGLLDFYQRARIGWIIGLAVCMMVAGCSNSSIARSGEKAAIGGAAEQGSVVLLSPRVPAIIPAMFVSQQSNAQVKIKIEMWDTFEQLLSHVQQGDAPFVVASLSVGANMHAKGLPLQLLEVDTWGSMYLVSVDSKVRKLADLQDETVYVPGQGGPAEILTRFLLRQEGLEQRVKLVAGTVPDIMQQLAAGKIRHAVLPEPVIGGLRAKLGETLHEVVDYQQVWRGIFSEDLPQSGIFVHSGWAKSHKKEVAQFRKLYREALARTKDGSDEVLKPAAEKLGLSEEALRLALPKITLNGKDATEARSEVERYFNILLKMNPDSIGGKLPDEDFYYHL